MAPRVIPSHLISGNASYNPVNNENIITADKVRSRWWQSTGSEHRLPGHFFEVGDGRRGRVEAGRYIVVSGNEKLPQISRWGKLLARQCRAYGLV